MPELAGIDRKWWIIGGGAAVAVVYWSYRKQKNAAAAQQAAQDQSQADTGVPTDQNYPYDTGYSGAYGVTPGIQGPGPGTPVLPITSNASWAISAEQYLTTLGYDPITVSAALGKYLSGQTLTADQMAIV